MKNELLWLDERIKESLTLPLEEQADSVFFYIHQMQSHQHKQRKFPVDLSLGQAAGKVGVPMAVEEDKVDLEFDLDFDFDFSFEEDEEPVTTNEIPLILREVSEEPIFTNKSTLVFTDTVNLRFDFLCAQLPSLTHLPLFPSGFSIKEWLLKYEGIMYVIYAEKPALYVLQGNQKVQIVQGNIKFFEENSGGVVIFALPDPLLLLNDWCIRTFIPFQDEAANEVVLMNYPLKREIYQYVQGCSEKKVLLVSASENREQATIRLNNLGSSFFLDEFEVHKLASLKYFTSVKSSPRTGEDVFFIPVWKAEANTWVHQDKKDDHKLEEIFTKNLVDMCNDWFISTDATKQQILGTLMNYAQVYEKNKTTMKKQMYRLKKDSPLKEKNAAFIVIDSCFNEIKKEFFRGFVHE